MRQFKFVSVLLMAMILAGCGGGGSDVPAKPRFAAQVSFGDSLSDVGSYNVGLVNAIGGGQFTINAASSVKATTPTNWTEYTSLSLGLGMPCAAETGLDNGSAVTPSTPYGTPAGTVIPVTDNSATCSGYAQGGSRVSQQPGIGNKLLGGGGFALTVPVVTQIQNFLNAHSGSFNGNDIVFVMAGANDVLFQAASIGGGLSPASGVAAVQSAADDLANAVKTQILVKGAKYVVVMNVPDIASTPYVTLITNATVRAQTAGLLDTLVTSFNTQLKADLPDSATVLNVDAYSASKDEVANKAKYNLKDVIDTACDLRPYDAVTNPNPYANPLDSSLACNANNLAAGVLPTDHYLFADTVHPTPYGHLLFATYVLQAMTNKGWY